MTTAAARAGARGLFAAMARRLKQAELLTSRVLLIHTIRRMPTPTLHRAHANASSAVANRPRQSGNLAQANECAAAPPCQSQKTTASRNQPRNTSAYDSSRNGNGRGTIGQVV